MNDVQHGRATRRDEDRIALDTWAARRRARLAGEPEDVRAEILSEARARLERIGHIDWGERDNELCRMRVMSRIRLKRYGAIPDGAEWQRQIEAVRESLGLDAGSPS
jgi:hypothetical protein